MVVFAIPLRARATSKDWNKCEERLTQTVRSIFNQTCGDFKCIIACNELPQLNCKYDERLEFIPLEMPIPQNWIEMARDKFWKLTVIAVRIRQMLEQQAEPEKGIYVMPVDADDLLNCKIAEYCKAHPDENGLVSDSGYVWKRGGGWRTLLQKVPQAARVLRELQYYKNVQGRLARSVPRPCCAVP